MKCTHTHNSYNEFIMNHINEIQRLSDRQLTKSDISEHIDKIYSNKCLYEFVCDTCILRDYRLYISELPKLKTIFNFNSHYWLPTLNLYRKILRDRLNNLAVPLSFVELDDIMYGAEKYNTIETVDLAFKQLKD